MVLENMGLPDPHDPDNSLSSSSDIIIHNNENNDAAFEDYDDNRYEGYHQLNGANDIPANDSDSEEDENEEVMGTSIHDQAGPSDLPAIDRVDNTLLKEVWSDSQSKDIEMDSDKVRAVKDAMLNFTLPASSIPDWASNIPEQEWKDHMLEKIKCKTTK